jgi:hypothetical protein
MSGVSTLRRKTEVRAVADASAHTVQELGLNVRKERLNLTAVNRYIAVEHTYLLG